MKLVARVAAGCVVLMILSASAVAQNRTRVLFLSKSSTFIHGPIKRVDGKPSQLDVLLDRLGSEHGYEFVSTKDAGEINAQNLKNFDVVMFYTTGDLTKEGAPGGLLTGDGNPAMSETGLDELLQWIRDGGRFIGYHSASDTFHGERNGPVSPYIEMLGGEFVTHGPQHFDATIRVTDPAHPAMKNFPPEWRIKDEWYVFKNFNTDSIHVLAYFDAGDAREKYRMYRGDAYPMVWCSQYGNGRVYYNGMGHREDVWENRAFQKTFIDALDWLTGDGPANAVPNFNNGPAVSDPPPTPKARKRIPKHTPEWTNPR